MKSHYTAKEIAAALGISERAVRSAAQKGKWPYRTVTCIGGREKEFEYLPLPKYYRRALLAHELDLSLEFVPENDIPENELKTLLSRFQAAPEYNRKRAIARCEILEAFASYQKKSGLSVTKAEQGFTELYKIQAAPGIALETYTTESKFSLGTLRRWKRLFKESGLAGLCTEYGKKKGRGNAVSPEMKIFIAGQIAQKPGIRPVRIYEMIQNKFNGSTPDRSTIYRFIDKWKKENAELVAMIEDPRQWKNKFQPAAGNMAADVPFAGHTWEMDSTPADVMTLDKIRCAIIGGIDVFTRRAKVTVAPASHSLAIAACMRRGILAWGVPARIRMDNGKDYKSKHVQAITTALQIETPPLPAYTPEKKPFIERFFGTMTRQLEENLPGYVGHSVMERQAIRERRTWGEKIMKRPEGGTAAKPVEIPLTMAELQEAVDKWLKVYESRVHGGLKGMSPKAKAEASTRHPARIRDERVLDILLAPVGKGKYTIQKKGLLVGGGQYWADEMVDLMKRTVQVRQDLEDAGTVYVFDAESGDYLCTARDDALTGKTLASYIQAKKRHIKNVKSQVRALHTISKTTTEPYTILTETGEIVNVETGEVLEGTTGGTVLTMQPEHKAPAVKEARKAFERKKPEPMGLADEMGVVIPMKPKREERTESGTIVPKMLKEKPDEWTHYPPELLDNPAMLYEWFEQKEEAVGLTEKERDHMKYLYAEFPQVKQCLELRGGTL